MVRLLPGQDGERGCGWMRSTVDGAPDGCRQFLRDDGGIVRLVDGLPVLHGGARGGAPPSLRGRRSGGRAQARRQVAADAPAPGSEPRAAPVGAAQPGAG